MKGTHMDDLTTKARLARAIGISKARISQLIGRGLPVEPDGKVSIAKAKAWIARHSRAGVVFDGAAAIGASTPVPERPASCSAFPKEREWAAWVERLKSLDFTRTDRDWSEPAMIARAHLAAECIGCTVHRSERPVDELEGNIGLWQLRSHGGPIDGFGYELHLEDVIQGCRDLALEEPPFIARPDLLEALARPTSSFDATRPYEEA